MGKSENWTITLSPHRSLTREGFVAIMVLVALINLIGGFMFFVAGAWPVAGFLGLDVLLVWWAFTRNYADAKRQETIRAEGDVVTLSRFLPDGAREETAFNRRWVRVDLEYDEARELVGRLWLRSHGLSHEIASFLGAEERASLAKALRRAL
jgi:uncharacterized membrane protein